MVNSIRHLPRGGLLGNSSLEVSFSSPLGFIELLLKREIRVFIYHGLGQNSVHEQEARMMPYTQREHANAPWWLVLLALLFCLGSLPAVTGA
jgi:hypothetical protein